MIPSLTLGTVRAIRDQTGVDLLRIDDPHVAAKVQIDSVWLGRAVAIAGGPAELAGDAIEDAVGLLMARLIEFFPKPSAVKADDDQTERKHDPWHAVFKAAGVAGLDPMPLSLRELFWAAEGAWEPHAEVLSLMQNVHAGKSQRPAKPGDFNPYARSGRTITRRDRK